MFLAVGNVVLLYGHRRRPGPSGACSGGLPLTGALLLVGLFAVTGSPPFGLFVSEFTILGCGRPPGARLAGPVAMVILLAIIFVGMAANDPRGGVWRARSAGAVARRSETLLVAGPAWSSWAASCSLLGVYLPAPLQTDARRRPRGRSAESLHDARSTTSGSATGGRSRWPACRLAVDSVSRDDRWRAARTGWRVVAFFGMPDTGTQDPVARRPGPATSRANSAPPARVVERAYPALTPECPELHYFERELAEQCAVRPAGHPGLKPVRRHPPDHAAGPHPPARTTASAYPVLRASRATRCTRWPSGPVHAGIIEPGHFRFQAHGEEVLRSRDHARLPASRGGAAAGDRLDRARAMLVAESIAGDTVIGHGGAYCGAIEALARSPKVAPRPGHPRHRAGNRAAGQPHRRPRRHRGRHRLPAGGRLLRPDAGRVPEPPDDDQRQPLWPRPGRGPAGRLRPSARRWPRRSAAGSPACATSWSRSPSSC